MRWIVKAAHDGKMMIEPERGIKCCDDFVVDAESSEEALNKLKSFLPNCEILKIEAWM